MSEGGIGPTIPSTKYGIRSPPPEPDPSQPNPGKRRRGVRSSDETGGAMSVEEYIHRYDTYRFRTMANPFPLPVKEDDLDRAHEGFSALNTLFPYLKEMLAKCGVKLDAYRMYAAIVEKPGYDAPKLLIPHCSLPSRQAGKTFVRSRASMSSELSRKTRPPMFTNEQRYMDRITSTTLIAQNQIYSD